MPSVSKRGRDASSLKCSVCGAVKPTSQFTWARDGRYRQGGFYMTTCRQCGRVKCSEYHSRRAGYINEKHRAYYWEHPQYYRDRNNLRYAAHEK